MEKRLKRTGFNPAFVQRVQYRPLNPAQFADDDQIDHDKTEHVDQDEAEVVVSTDDEIVEKYTDNFADQRIGGGVEFVRIRLGDGDRIPYGRYGRVDDGDRFDADMFDAQQAVDFHQHQLEQMLLVEQQSRIRSIHRHRDIRYVTADGRHHKTSNAGHGIIKILLIAINYLISKQFGSPSCCTVWLTCFCG
ncbi:Imidazolonepropionase [Trichinella spiralis]|uniref:Imidazolonepropionase n=1 Tax=Trichinella spiralis TaxID=6334 RepID=A0ABR3KVG9_TRISP